MTKTKGNKGKGQPNEANVQRISPDRMVSNLSGLQKPVEYIELIHFTSLPRAMRKSIMGVSEQHELAKKLGVEPATLSDWKNRAGFWEDVANIRRDMFRERTGDVLLALENKALRTGDAAEAKLLLEFTGELKRENDTNKVPELLAEAIRRVASVLPDRETEESTGKKNKKSTK